MAQVVARPLCYRVVLGSILGRVMPKDFKICTSQPSVSTKGLDFSVRRHSKSEY